MTFSDNNDNAAKTTTATFTAGGNYTFLAVITNALGHTITSSVSVTVDPTLTTITVSPTGVHLNPGKTQHFIADAYDQFGNALADQPTFDWTTTAGTIDLNGLLTAPETSVPAVR